MLFPLGPWLVAHVRVALCHACQKWDSCRSGARQRYSITAQLLILYYILSYEESLLASTKQLGRYR